MTDSARAHVTPSPRGRQLFTKFEGPLTVLSRALAILPMRVRMALLKRSRGFRGLAGMGLRYCMLRAIGATSSPNVSIREDVYLVSPLHLRLGANVSIHPLSYIDATGGIEIGDEVSIAHGVTVMSSSHNFADTNIPINAQGITNAATKIEHNCWIGAKAVLVAGITIGEGSIVGANSVVTKDVPRNSVVAGAPARLLKVLGEP